MRLIRQIERQGAFLFRWRSYLPLTLLPATLVALNETAYFEAKSGVDLHDWWVYICMLISLAGLAVRWVTIGFVPSGTSGRNTRYQRADRLNTTGIYSVVRHPLYLGNFIVILGLALSLAVWWFVLLVSLAYWLYIERIITAEEAFLASSFGKEYNEWADHTPTFMPSFSRWRCAQEPICLRMILRREYNGVLAVALAYFVMEAFLDVLIEGEPFFSWLQEDRVWTLFLVGSFIVFLCLRTAKKHTDLLRVSRQ